MDERAGLGISDDREHGAREEAQKEDHWEVLDEGDALSRTPRGDPSFSRALAWAWNVF